MINKIGANLETYTGIKKINFRANTANTAETAVTFPEIQPDNKGLDALAAYNNAIVKQPVITKDKLNLEPVSLYAIPDNTEELEGERIYSSDGKLNSIVKRDEKTYTVYTPFENNENLFESITTYDKFNDRQILKEQTNNTEDGKYTSFFVKENDPKTGKTLRSSKYENGNLYSISKTIFEPNGKETKIYYYLDDNRYYVYITSPDKNNDINATFDKNKQLLYIEEFKKNFPHRTTNTINFYNGAPISVNSSKETVIPNTLGYDIIKKHEELKPAAPFEKIENIKDINGEKKYYSNGALESNTFDSDNGKTTAFFTPEGSCYKIESDKITVVYDAYKNCIIETLENGDVKETCISNIVDDISVTVKNDSSYKTASYTKNGKPKYYEEGIIDNGEEKYSKYLSFINGCLDYASEINID